MIGLSKNFWLLSFSLFFFMVSFNLILPELNDFISMLGGEKLKGLIIVLFTISAAISRPFSGKLADTIGRKKVILYGGIICVFASLMYPFSFAIWFFLLIRFIHGFSAGFLPTGATALVTDLLPEDSRGKGMGIWGVFISLGIGFGQYIGGIIAKYFTNDFLFIAASLFAVVSIILQAFLRETLVERQKFSLKLLKIKKEDIIEPNVIPAALVMFLTAICSGIVFIIVPDIAEFINIENKGSFFGIYVLSTIFVRLVAGPLSDKIGRVKMMLASTFLLMISMLLIGTIQGNISFILASIVFGIATGLSSPTLFAWTADLSPIERRGVGAGTMFIALEIGIMVGSFSTVLLYHNSLTSIFYTCLFGAISTFLAFLYLISKLRIENRKKIA